MKAGTLAEIISQVRYKATEAGFPGWVEFKVYMPYDGLYDSGILPDKEVSTITRILREDLPSHAKGKPVIYICYKTDRRIRSKGSILATLAHELGHSEQPPELRPVLTWSPEWLAREIDADSRGFKWARKWSVVPQYLSIRRKLKEIAHALGLPFP